MSVAIVDYGSGNLRSAAKAFERAARDLGRAVAVSVTDDPDTVARAERIVLPGVGAFADCMAGLTGIPGMAEALAEAVLRRGRPFFGICVGMQLLAARGLEFGGHPGLDWLGGEVVRLAPAEPALKVPHMGWNALRFPVARPHPLFAGIAAGSFVYFVHSYAYRPADPGLVLAEVDYGGPVAAAVGRDNIVATQFHPEKSQAAGLAIIANFLNWRP